MNLATARIGMVVGVENIVAQEISVCLARDGAALAIVYQGSARYANTVVSQINLQGGRALALQITYNNVAQIAQLFDEVIARLGPLDFVVTCASASVNKASSASPPEAMPYSAEDTASDFGLLRSEAARHLVSGGCILHVVAWYFPGVRKTPDALHGEAA